MNINLTGKDLIKIANSDDIFAIMQKILLRENKLDREKEHFWLIGLNTANKILFVELISLGGVRSTTVEPMNVFRMSVIKGAIKVILVHNHPSGEVKPSKGDLDTTDRLIQVGKILDVKVIDHLIITEKIYMSFGDTGRMQELEESTKWVPSYELINRVKKEEAAIRKEAVKNAKEKGEKAGHKKGEKQKALGIAKGMKQKGYDLNDIIELTGITKTEISKL